LDFTTHPFLNILWTMFVIFVWLAWFWLLITISIDIFRRRDIGGGQKTLWFILIIFLPLIGSLVYIISQGGHMAERNIEEAQRQQQAFDSYVDSRVSASGPAAEIEKAKALLDSGAIDQAEFQRLKAKAIG
jgi:putative oligomerization/nucleic acid binding protein/phospholipase D-like protein